MGSKSLKKQVLILILLIVLLPKSGLANLSKLANEYLLENSSINSALAKSEVSKLDIDALNATKTWSLSYDGEKASGNLVSSSTLLSPESETTSQTLSLAKGFSWGGTFVLDNTLSHLDQDATLTTTKINRYGLNQGVTYSQDLWRNFFGREFDKSVEVLESTYKSTEASTQETINQGLLSFTQAYNNTLLQKALVSLQGEAIQRAKRRLNLIRKRVKDGLREKVDLYQAQMALVSQAEQTRTAEVNLESALDGLNGLLHRKVEVSEIRALTFSEPALSSLPTGEVLSNKNLKSLKEIEKIFKASYDVATLGTLPSLAFSAGYRTNGVGTIQSTAINDGTFGGKNSEKTVGLSLTWNIGSAGEEIAKSQALLNYKTAENTKAKLHKSLVVTETILKTQIKKLDENLKANMKRMSLANKTLSEYNRLYKRGRADLDQVIRSEEALINTQKSFVTYFTQREGLVYSLAVLYGDLKGYLVK